VPITPYLISLPRRQDRRDEWATAWDGYGFNPPRVIDGVDGSALPADRVDSHMRTALAAGHKIKHRRHFAGTLGCLLAHRAAWQTWLMDRSPGGYLLLMEDDASPTPGLTPARWLLDLQQAVRQLPPGWLMLNLGAKVRNQPREVPGAPSLAYSGRDTQCLHAILYTVDGVMAMLKATADQEQPLDFAWRPVLAGGNCYSTRRWLAIQRWSYSDISHFTRSPHLDHRQRIARFHQPEVIHR